MLELATRWVRGLAWFYIGYVLLVVLLIMPAANVVLPRVFEQQTGRKLSFDLLVINPVNLSVRLQNARLDDPNGTEFVHFDALAANLSLLQSVWRQHLVLDQLALRQLRLDVRRDANGRFNFQDILDHQAQLAGSEAPPQTEEPAGELPAVTVNSIVFDAKYLAYREQRVESEPFASAIRDFHLQLRDFTTYRQEGEPYHLKAEGPDGGSLLWEGDLSVAGSHSQGRLLVDKLNMLPAYQYFAPWLGFTASSFRLGVDANYQLSWAPAFRFNLSDSRVTVQDLVLQARQDSESSLSLRELALSGLAVDSVGQTVSAKALAIAGLEVSGHSKEGDVSLVPMFAVNLPAADENPAVEKEEPSAPWHLHLDRVALADSQVNWRAAELSEPLILKPRLKVSDLTWPPQQPAVVQLELSINQETRFRAAGGLRLDGSQLSLAGDLQKLPLAWINPELGRYLNARIDSGQLSSQWWLEIKDGALQGASLAAGSVDEFSLQSQGEVAGWKQLAWHDVALTFSDRRLSIEQITLDGGRARFAILEGGSTNLGQLVLTQESGGNEAAESDAESAEAASGQPQWSLAVKQMAVRDSQLDFSDATLALPFRANIQQFAGQVDGLDSSANTPARVDLAGKVDGYAPVALLGTVQPLSEPPSLDLAFNFKNLDLATLTPYSGTYAGYSVKRGLLTVELDYELENNRIQGDNRVVINQLQLGQTIESPRAIDLPLKLAIALLTDRNGVIDLGVPVKGSIDDPEFSLGQVIWGAFRNVLLKAVTAPFTLLANLVGSDQPLDHVGFVAGSNEFDGDAERVLDQLAEALSRRPALRVALTGHVGADDQRALAEQQLSQILVQRGLDQDELAGRGKDWAKACRSLYRELFSESEEDDPKAIYEQLIAHQTPDPGRMNTLAAERALKVKQALVVERQLDPERVFLQRPDQLKAEHGGVSLAAEV